MSRIRALQVVLLTLVVMAFATDAAAHTGAPVFDVQEASARGGTIRLEVGVTYSLDGDAAEGAFLTAVPVAPDGRTRAAIDLTRRPNGVYVLETEADSVGRWTFQITSRFPSGSTEVQVDVTETAGAATRPSARSRPEEGGRPEWVVPAVVAGALLIGLAASVIRRQRRRLR